MLGQDYIGIYGAVVSGLLAGVGIGFFTEYFTSDSYKPTKDLAEPTRPVRPPSSSAACLWV